MGVEVGVTVGVEVCVGVGVTSAVGAGVTSSSSSPLQAAASKGSASNRTAKTMIPTLLDVFIILLPSVSPKIRHPYTLYTSRVRLSTTLDSMSKPWDACETPLS